MAKSKLTALNVKRAQHDGRAGHRMMAVGGDHKGLYLQVTARHSKSWILRIVVNGKRREIGLGAFPEIGLADAQELAITQRNEIKRAAKDGRDPVAERHAQKVAARAERIATNAPKLMTFADAVKAFCHRDAGQLDGLSNAKHRAQWESTLMVYAVGEIDAGRKSPRNRENPKGIGADGIGAIAVADLTKHDIARILEPIWHEIPETARRVRSRIEAVIRWADGKEGRDRANPAQWSDLKHHGNLTVRRGQKQKALAAQKSHHPALHFYDAPEWFADLKRRPSVSARALQFVVLTACRSQEVRGARWSELSDLDGRNPIWTVPGDRMKMGQPHRVPLSRQAVAMIKAMPRHLGSDFVFVAPRGGPLGDMALSKMMKDQSAARQAACGAGWIDKANGRVATPHGLRSTFRTWVQEDTEFPREVAESALAHLSGDAVERAYARGDALARRRDMMQAWADYLTGAQAAKQAGE
ncbi:integrase arm-type DNA-binding domain-containing protein [uncultured Paracoccus sp.]|uniref:tyrosine-type recombinase/integrase n=1 Tax=uncultured Paracoccus sp. TaxID=189685 RepID=UPI0030DC87E8|tara:strand:+ start:5063 stop:6472 length:1410 start_codon:yes stop_codon:yes gene_type:complete